MTNTPALVSIGSGVPKQKGASTDWRPKRPSVYAWLLAPAVLVVLGFAAYPIIRTIVLSFTDQAASPTSADWVGAENYVRLAQDSLFWQSLRVTGVFVLVSVTLELILAWSMALLLAKTARRLNTIVRTILTIPMMLSPVVIGVSWRMLLNPQYGWINSIFGLRGTDWIGTHPRALGVIIAVDAWQWTPFIFLMLVAGLNAIPHDVYEAAKLDGANAFQTFRHITFPLMLPITFVAVLLRSVDATKAFDLPFNLTSGGPGNTTTTAAIFMYRRAFGEFDQGYASALAVTVTALLLVYAVLYLKGLRTVERKLWG